MKKLALILLLSFFAPQGASAANCPTGTGVVCTMFSSFWSTFTYLVTGGTTSRGDYNRWVDNWVEAPEIGLDCTGTTDGSTTLTNAINANKSLHLMLPLGCNIKLGSTVAVSNTLGLKISGPTPVGQGTGTTAKFTWAGGNGSPTCGTTFANCVFMFDIEQGDHPTFSNLKFATTSSGCLDGFLKFDGDPSGNIGTQGTVRNVVLEYSGACSNANFVAISISKAAGNNHENYVVDTATIFCNGGNTILRSRDGVTNGTTTLTSATANFTGGDVGQRIILSYANGELTTTIASVTNSTTVVLTDAPAWSQTGVSIHTGTRYGVGIRNGPSQNAIQQKFSKIVYVGCAVGIQVDGGNAEISQPSGGSSDLGIYISGFVVQPSSIDYYAAENDLRAVYYQTGSIAPLRITNARWVNNDQLADGYLIFGSNTTILNSSWYQDPPTNGTLINHEIGVEPTATLVSINNSTRGLSSTQIGYDYFTQPRATWMGDIVDTTNTPKNNFSSYGNVTGTRAYSGMTNTDGVGLQGYAYLLDGFGNNTHRVIGVQGTGNTNPGASATLNDFVGVQGLGAPGAFSGEQIAVEAAWDTDGLNTAGGTAIAAYGFRARTPASINSGALPAMYGLYIDKQKITNVTAGWGVYQADSADQNFFAGPVLFKKNTASASAPGAANGKIELVCGTNAGTAKIIAYAGTSSTATTVLDNIGSGVSGC